MSRTKNRPKRSTEQTAPKLSFFSQGFLALLVKVLLIANLALLKKAFMFLQCPW
jgi:hypothetical protein